MSVSRSAATAPAAPPAPSPAAHPMDPRHGRGPSPKFSAFLCWLLNLPAMTDPAIVDAVVTGDCVFVATTDDPSFNHLLGSWQDCKANLRGWGDACTANPHTVDALIAKARHGAGCVPGVEPSPSPNPAHPHREAEPGRGRSNRECPSGIAAALPPTLPTRRSTP